MAGVSNNSNIDDSLLITNGDGKKISAKTSVNLQSYIDIFNREGPTGLNFKLSRAQLIDQTSGLSGHLFWENTLNCAMKNADLTSQQQDELKNSPACQYMYDGFIEVLKNVMDEAILGHYENGLEPQLELILNIDLSIPEQIAITLTDNGRGFPSAFLEKNATLQGKDNYIRENNGSSKLDARDLPPLFGGAGLGLRQLMAKALYGAELIGPGVLNPKYEKPGVSEINLENRAAGVVDEHGAVIQIRTSLAPLIEKQIQQISYDTPPLKLPTRRKPKMLSDAPESYKKTMTLLARKDSPALQSENKDCTIEEKDSSLNVNIASGLECAPFLLSNNLYGHFSENKVIEFADELIRSVMASNN